MLRRVLLALLLGLAAVPVQAAEYVFAIDAPRPQGRHTAYFVALDRGFYREAGLDIRIVPGRGSADGINRIAAGEATFAFGDAGALVLARAKGAQVKMVSVIYASSPFVIFSLKGTPIANPKDLEGKTIAAPPTDGMRTMFPVFAKVAGIDASKVQWIDIPIEKKDQALLAREVDAMTSGLQQRPLLAKAAAARNLEVQTLRWGEYGFALYSNGLLVSDALIASNPALVKGFVAATMRGFAATFADPEAAVATMMRLHPTLDEAIVRAEIDIVRGMAQSEHARNNGLGWIDEATMQATVDAVAEVFKVEKPPVASLYSNAFIR